MKETFSVKIIAHRSVAIQGSSIKSIVLSESFYITLLHGSMNFLELKPVHILTLCDNVTR